jgi:hypothetical protein
MRSMISSVVAVVEESVQYVLVPAAEVPRSRAVPITAGRVTQQEGACAWSTARLRVFLPVGSLLVCFSRAA